VIWVFDSSPLIYLNKVGLQWIFTHLDGDKIVPLQVYDQVVVQGKARGDADAILSEDLVKKGVLRVVRVENGFMKTLRTVEAGLHEGELEVLALAKNLKGTAIVDEGIAREVGNVFGIEVHGTLFLIFLMVREGNLKTEEAKSKVNLMIKRGFRLGHETYVRFLELMEPG
jgi:predicted nucleic acid-binding protein